MPVAIYGYYIKGLNLMFQHKCPLANTLDSVKLIVVNVNTKSM